MFTVDSEAAVFFRIPIFVFLASAGNNDIASILYGPVSAMA
jgi:hypothetical protein